MKPILILTACVLLFAFGFYIGTQNEQNSLKTNETEVIRLNKVIDSLGNVRDTLFIREYETRIKWRTKIITDSIYIDNAADSLQPIIRSNLRERYRNLRESG